MKVAVYYLLDPRDNAIRYVGIAKDPERRFLGHCAEISSTHKVNWIHEVFRATGTLPEMVVKCWVQDWQEAQRVEIALIAYLRQRGVALTNTTDGGDGGATRRGRHEPTGRVTKGFLGKTHSEEARTRISEAHFGQKRPQSQCDAISAGLCKAWERRKAEGRTAPWNKGLKRGVRS